MSAVVFPGGSADASPSSPAEGRPGVLHQNERTRVSRALSPYRSGTVIRKEALGRGAAARLAHELAILTRLADVDGVIRPVPHAPDHTPALLLEDVGGRPLAELVTRELIDVADLPRLALALARILASVHRAGVVHRDLNPANILLVGPSREPLLIDFDLATTNASVRPGFTHHREIVGRLPYLAPEQTGRTGLSVDLRADMYGLGATLYELAAGHPPFGGGDPLALVRDILGRVPRPLAEFVPGVPRGFSDVVARLLEKEPDRRYQSAEGLAHDLSLLCADPATRLRLGERDFPSRLSPPSGLVGRDAEIRTLRAALDSARHTASRGLFVAGAPGIGKSALLEQLRAMVTAEGGWFIAGKADQYRHDAASGVFVQALRALGRLLLAEPEADLAEHRTRILDTLGANAPLLAAPEFQTLLGPDLRVAMADPRETEERLRRAAVDLLRVVSSAERPIALVLDDLQWASPTALRIIDAVLTDDGLRHVLLVGAFREQEVHEAHPLAALLPRWERLDAAPPVLRLANLGGGDLGVLLGGMLRLPAAEVTGLAAAVGERTAGNPFDTVELVNALRRDGVLALSEAGWTWDQSSVRRYVGQGDVVDLLAERIDRLPDQTRELLQLMAYLGGEVRLDVLAAASGYPEPTALGRLEAALEDGLLVPDEGVAGTGARAVRFRHDRVRQAARDGLDPRARSGLQLTVARRLAALPGFEAEAAELYLATVDRLHEADERRRAAELFATAAAGARRISVHATAERYLAAAIRLWTALGVGPDDPALVGLETEWHATLYSLGRHDEADEVYRSVERRCADPLALVDAASIQVCSLSNRHRQADAVALGFALLGRLGFALPGEDVRAEIARRERAMYDWIERASVAEDLVRSELTDERATAAAQLIQMMTPAAYFGFAADPVSLPWLVGEAQRLWEKYGPCAPLVPTIASSCFSTVMVGDDYSTGVRMARHVMAVGEIRGYETATAQARYLYAVSGCHWFEPIEEEIRLGRAAREVLLRGGDLQSTCLAFWPSIFSVVDYGPTVDDLMNEANTARAFATRTGNSAAAAIHAVYQQFVRAMRGETAEPGSFTDASLDEEAYLQTNERVALHLHIYRALSAALFGDAPALVRHAAAATRLVIQLKSTYPHAVACLLQALATTHSIRAADTEERPALLAELDRCADWLARRAEQAPENFRHLLRFVEAERAWATGDFRAAASAFDASLHQAESRQRPWHQALIAERAGLFHLAHGLERAGRGLLAEARRHYKRWGATGKVRELDRTHSFLRTVDRARLDTASTDSGSVRSDDIDMLAILRASQALSSETSLDRLHASVVDQMQALTGATAVRLVLFDADAHDWFVPATGSDDDRGLPVQEAAERGLLPLTAFRYAERTREPLFVEDATRDDRFSRDPYLAGVDRCSLLAVPIVKQGGAQAVLILENRLSSGVFTVDRLDAVLLIAGQLAVSLDNALLYRHLEDNVARRTRELQAANEQLETLSLTDPLTGLANRRRFDDILAAGWRQAVAAGSAIGIALIDIDHFKRYNDEYGHPAGDACLRQVAGALAASIRQETDLVCRYGGEEFAIILPGADRARATAVAERAREAVAALALPHSRTDAGFVTVSVGVAAVEPTGDDNADHLVKTADIALYQAKQRGRNRVWPRRPLSGGTAGQGH